MSLVVGWPARFCTSVTTTEPRTPATAFGVRISMTSPARIRSRATASANFPDSMSMVDRPGTSVMVTTERSRTVTTALPPRSMRASDSEPVVILSCTRTSSLNFSGTGCCGADACVAVTFPSSVVTTPALGACAQAMVDETARTIVVDTRA